MKSRRKTGGTLALVVALILVIVIVGIGFVVWQLLLGGGKELQLATDSGSLNVAKQVLLQPSIEVPAGQDANGINLRQEFGPVLDGGTRVNLLNFNRLVAKAVLAQINAQAQFNSTNDAKANAAQLTTAVYTLGNQLRDAIDNADALGGHFDAIAGKASVRMLDARSKGGVKAQVAARDEDHAVAYMARGAASNVFFRDGQLTNSGLLQPNLVTKSVPGVGNDLKFLVGYQAVSTANGVGNGIPATYAIPMRPGEQPHNVTENDFRDNRGVPVAGTLGGQMLPNAFKSGGKANDNGINLSAARASAVIGVLSRVFPAEQSGGTIIIDNASCFTGSGTFIDASNFQFEGTPLMQPDAIEVFSYTLNNGTWPFSADNQVGSNSARFMCKVSATGGTLPSAFLTANAQSTLTDNVSGNAATSNSHHFPSNAALDPNYLWAMVNTGKVRYRSQFPARCTMMGTTQGNGEVVGGSVGFTSSIAVCNNNDFGGPDGDPFCPANSEALVKYAAGVPQLPSSVTLTDAMLLEVYIATIKQGFTGAGGAGCVSASAFGGVGSCGLSNRIGSGLKDVGVPGAVNQPPFPSNLSLNRLFTITGTPQSVKDDIEKRIRQINPDANVNAIFNQNVPFGSLFYIKANASNTGVEMNATPPGTLAINYANQPCTSRPVKSAPLNVPDGIDPTTPAGAGQRGRVEIGVSSTWVPFFMWECGNGMQSGRSASVSLWYPSSGKGGLLGVMRFTNCPEASGPQWCCP